MASNEFGFDLYAQLNASQENLICSPVSAWIAMTMAMEGARTGTWQEMARTLHRDPHGEGRVSSVAFGRLLDELNQRDGQKGLALHVADRLWGQRGHPFVPAFLRLVRERYKAPLALVDFAQHTEEARLAINQWALLETHGRVRDVLRPGDLDQDTRLVLTNAVYFKGGWDVPFAKAETTDRPFTAPEATVIAKMMHRQATIRYARDRDVQVVELAYRGGISMVVLLPDAPDGLHTVETLLPLRYQSWIEALDYDLIDLELPRWTVTSRMPLAGALSAMGMPTAFTAAADFAGMSRKRLHIQNVIQQAFVNVDEEGAEAAAVTVVGMAAISDNWPSGTPIAFHVNHPFMYLLRDTQTGTILFIGRVVNPLP